MSKKPNRVVQYKMANEKFLEQKAQEEGIKALESGILIREIEKGSGTRSPQLRSTVYIHYTGRLIDGTVFDSTEGQLPACFRVDELIVGWQAALLRMHEGDTFQIFLPEKYGYGSAKIDGIPVWSTLEFTLTLLKIQSPKNIGLLSFAYSTDRVRSREQLRANRYCEIQMITLTILQSRQRGSGRQSFSHR